MDSSNNKPVALVLGVTGQLGKLISDRLHKDATVALRVSSRKRHQLARIKDLYGEAVYLDLDDPRTFAEALRGVGEIVPAHRLHSRDARSKQGHH